MKLCLLCPLLLMETALTRLMVMLRIESKRMALYVVEWDVLVIVQVVAADVALVVAVAVCAEHVGHSGYAGHAEAAAADADAETDAAAVVAAGHSREQDYISFSF